MFFRLVVSVFTLVICAAFFVNTFSLRTMSGSDPGGPAMFPRFLIAVTAVCATIELVSLIRANGMEGVRTAMGDFLTISATDANARLSPPQRVTLAMVLSAVYPLVLLKIGFILATTMFVMTLAFIFRIALPVSFVMGIIISVGIFVVFAEVLHVRVPPGQWFDIKGLLF